MIDLLFVGDIAVQGDGDLTISSEILLTMQKYDVRVCNFEGAVGDRLSCTAAPKAGPLLLQSEKSYAVVSQLGFDVYGLANNHVLDYGESCLRDTVKTLKANDGVCIGAPYDLNGAYEPYVFEKGGLRIAIFSAAENSFGTQNDHCSYGHAYLFSRELLVKIREYRQCCDKIILSAHAGLENLNVPMPEWVDVYKTFIDAGVDVVIGHHPHVVQGWEEYGNGLIFYSLGNFLWQRQKQNFVDLKTIMVGLHIEGSEISYDVIPVQIVNNELLLNENDQEYTKELEDYCTVLKPQNRMTLIKMVDDFCVKLYNGAFVGYISNTCGCIVPNDAKGYIKSIARCVLRKHKLDHNFVYHNSAVETNNWVCQRAIRKTQEKH